MKRHTIQLRSSGGKSFLITQSHHQTSLADVEHKAEKIVFRAQENTAGCLRAGPNPLSLLRIQEKTATPLVPREQRLTVCSFIPPLKAAERKGRYHGNRPSQEAQWSKHRQSHDLLCPQSRLVGKYYTRHIPETQSKQ